MQLSILKALFSSLDYETHWQKTEEEKKSLLKENQMNKSHCFMLVVFKFVVEIGAIESNSPSFICISLSGEPMRKFFLMVEGNEM